MPYHIQGSGNYSFQMLASDPDGDPVTFATVMGGTGGFTINSTGLLTRATPGYGLHIIAIEARDNSGGVTSLRRLVNVMRGEGATPFVADPPRQYWVRVGESFSEQLRVWSPTPSANSGGS